MSSMLARTLRRWFGWFPKKRPRSGVDRENKRAPVRVEVHGAVNRCIEVDHRFYGRIRLLADDPYVSAHILNGETVWEQHLVDLFATHFRPGWNVVDVGANLGLHTIALAKLAKLGELVFAFEPHPEIFPLAETNCSSHANIRLFRLAASDSLRDVKMSALAEVANKAGISLIEGDDQGSHPIATVTLDSMQLPRIGLMKIDVEGHELACLRGAEATIRRDKPVLIVEIMGGNDIRTASPEIVAEIQRRIDYVCSLGYRCIHIESHDFLFLPE
ncbi:MAG: FkbM family methyltransferase [Pirellulales bacterium]